VYHLSVFVHVLSAVVWVGGMLFLALVAIPVVRGLEERPRAELVARMGERFRPVAWTCILLLVASGVANLAYRGVTWESVITGRLWQSPFGQVLAWKLAMVAAMVALSAWHDFALGPASTRLARAADPADESRRAALRRRAAWVGRVNAVLAVGVLGAAVMLVRGLPR
jgi:putative copper export protein